MDLEIEIAAGVINMEFTQEWFTNEEAILKLIEMHKPRKMLEIGAFEGRSTCSMMLKAAESCPISYHVVDSWMGGFEHDGMNFAEIEHRFDANMNEALGLCANPVTMHKCKGLSHKALSKFISEDTTFDFIYIDGSHKAADVMLDAVMCFKILQIHGLLIFDDYLWGITDKYLSPKLAIDNFFNCFDDKLVDLIPNDPTYQKFFQKVAE